MSDHPDVPPCCLFSSDPCDHTPAAYARMVTMLEDAGWRRDRTWMMRPVPRDLAGPRKVASFTDPHSLPMRRLTIDSTGVWEHSVPDGDTVIFRRVLQRGASPESLGRVLDSPHGTARSHRP